MPPAKAEFVRRKFSAVCEMRLARCKFGTLCETFKFGEQIYIFAPPVFALPPVFFTKARFALPSVFLR